MRNGKMLKVDPKLLLIFGGIALFVNSAYGCIEAIPLPHELMKCFKTLTQTTNVRDLAGEEIHTSCMFAWEIYYSRYHSCSKNNSTTSVPKPQKPKRPRIKSRPQARRRTTTARRIRYRWYTQTGVQHRRYRRSMRPERILPELIRDFTENKDKKRRKRWFKKKVRKEYRMLTNKERRDYHKAVNMLKNANHYINFDYISEYHTGDTLGRAHRGPCFPGWHRVYLLYYEQLLDYYVPGVALPYWDSTIDKEMADPTKSIIWTEGFMGNGYGLVTTGPFKNWRTANDDPLIRNLGNGERIIHKENVTLILSQSGHKYILFPTGTDLRYNFEAQHNGPHVYVGGHMSRLSTAAMDPMFYMHHAYMDYIWEKFRQQLRAKGTNPEKDYPVEDAQLINGMRQGPNQPLAKFPGLKNIDGYSDFWTEFYFTYQDSATCNRVKQCGSPYYECLRPKNRCTSVTEAAFNAPRQAANVAHEMVALAAGPPPPPPPPGLLAPQKKVQAFLGDIKQLSDDSSLSIAAAAVSFSPPSLRLEVEKDLKASCLGETIQNTFTIDCESDVDKWAFFAVQIIHLRTGRRKFNEQIIKKGRPQRGHDMFSPKNYAKLEHLVGTGKPASFATCPKLKSGAAKIFIQSHGLSYSGEYREYAFIDEREPISSTIGYTAVKKPTNGATKAYISAIDSCGRLCKPWCLVKGSRPLRYERCSGAIRVTSKTPLMYGNTYGDAILDHWKIDDPDDLPLPSHKGVFMIFYCDYKETWPW